MEEVSCALEVDVNGQETFLVDKRILSSFSGRISKLFGKSTETKTKLKLIFHDFPGGADGFELMARFCYNNGRTHITPSNISLLHCVAHFMEMTKDISGNGNLIEQTEKSLEEIGYWSWSELVEALKQCQTLLPAAISSVLLQKCLESLVAKLVSSSDENSSISSPDSSGFRFSCDTKSTESGKNIYSRPNWWFEDLVILNPELIDKVIKTMLSRKFDHLTISKFLFYYQKSRSLGVNLDKKRKITETVIDLLFLLDWSSVSCKSLFGILWVALGLNISKCSRTKLEGMIGLQLDQATLDNLLIPSPPGINSLYDVNLVLRFLKSFLLGGDSWVSITRMKKVANLIDLYISEVAPDPSLRPSKFVALAIAVPDSGRDSYDEIYRAMDMYLEVHAGLSEEEKMKICCALNYEKLSSSACKHLAQNTKFPSRTTVQALISQQSKLNNLLQETNHLNSRCSYTEKENGGKRDKDKEQVVLYAKKLDFSTENEKLREHIQGMQWRVMELEKICRKMQTQLAKVIKSKVSSSSSSGNGARSLPRLCS
ncbi:BTB/POZ-like [Macleaya cordata]|uniref:BTB/POZ-like n=1 Tax=Macleaya cordata TaxID=56857 RepID=A0A200QRV4_MACCD|nr:BTB/POZ-like [Macleaya cordata]